MTADHAQNPGPRRAMLFTTMLPCILKIDSMSAHLEQRWISLWDAPHHVHFVLFADHRWADGCVHASTTWHAWSETKTKLRRAPAWSVRGGALSAALEATPVGTKTTPLTRVASIPRLPNFGAGCCYQQATASDGAAEHGNLFVSLDPAHARISATEARVCWTQACPPRAFLEQPGLVGRYECRASRPGGLPLAWKSPLPPYQAQADYQALLPSC